MPPGGNPNTQNQPPQQPAQQPPVAAYQQPRAQAPGAVLPDVQPQVERSDKKKSRNGNSTQNSLKIAEIRDGLVIMQDGSFRAVILARSVNFDLMSQNEQEAIEISFQDFINALYFPIQIMIRSYRVDLKNYMEKLEKIRKNQDNVLLSLLMEDYMGYVDYLIETSNIMEKQFYVVVPFNPSATLKNLNRSNGGIISKVFKQKTDKITINEAEFTKAKQEMRQRVSSILEEMNQMGVQSVPLNTQELMELYYNVYNPDTATVQTLASHHDLEADVITKGDGYADTFMGAE